MSSQVAIAGAKNAALPALAACLLTDEPMRLSNLPDVHDVRTMLRVLEQLGADASRVLRLVVARGMLFAGAGVLVGLAGAFASTRVLSSVLFEVGTHDPVTFVGVASALSVIALLACWVPAFRASRVDPVVALKE